jgi:hypothetical protein
MYRSKEQSKSYPTNSAQSLGCYKPLISGRIYSNHPVISLANSIINQIKLLWTWPHHYNVFFFKPIHINNEAMQLTNDNCRHGRRHGGGHRQRSKRICPRTFQASVPLLLVWLFWFSPGNLQSGQPPPRVPMPRVESTGRSLPAEYSMAGDDNPKTETLRGWGWIRGACLIFV